MNLRHKEHGAPVFGIALLLLALAAQGATGQEWQVVQKRGAVLMLVGDQWREISRGEVIADGAAIRTLQGGRVELQRPGASITLGTDTVLQTLSASDDRDLRLRQYSGSIDLNFGPNQASTARVETPTGAITTKGGALTISLTGEGGIVTVASGTATVTRNAGGQALQLESGQSAATGVSPLIVRDAQTQAGHPPGSQSQSQSPGQTGVGGGPQDRGKHGDQQVDDERDRGRGGNPDGPPHQRRPVNSQ